MMLCSTGGLRSSLLRFLILVSYQDAFPRFILLSFPIALGAQSADGGHPLPTKDGGTLRTVEHARAYMLALSGDRELRSQWQRACELLLAGADVGELTKQIELALLYDAKLVVVATKR
jgi:hypothetical protein